MEKVVLVKRVIYFLIVTGILSYIFIETSGGNYVLLPFIICSVSLLIKNIFMLFGKYDKNVIFNKIYIIGFLLFWFGFLILYCYMCLISKEYLILLFTIPFWIVGIYVIRKRLK